MNKLFIIGNGFDLAHGYPTSYSHFVKWIWNNIQKNPEDNDFKKIIEIHPSYRILGNYSNTSNCNVNCFEDFKNAFDTYIKGHVNVHNGGMFAEINYKRVYTFHNRFFYMLCLKYPKADWSDIESLFYDILIEVLNSSNKYGINIDSLNDDMEIIKNLFSKYLLENVKYENVDFEMPFPNLLKYKSNNLNKATLSKESIKYLNEFPSILRDSLIKFDSLIETAEDFNNWTLNGTVPQTLILDFNYTDTINQYINSAINRNSFEYGAIEHIKIHGDLKDSYNPINLGFGDEMDDYYHVLEKKNDNRYLRYIKSFMYSNNTNYRKLLNWIYSNEFQVYILGHSCGLSDRIMLNTIFEHINCKSIKLHYYEWKDNNGITKDDFTDKVQNISRHFNKKSLMRDKIVDKSLSNPLKIFN